MGTQIIVAITKLAVFAILFGLVLGLAASEIDSEAFEVITNLESLY